MLPAAGCSPSAVIGGMRVFVAVVLELDADNPYATATDGFIVAQFIAPDNQRESGRTFAVQPRWRFGVTVPKAGIQQ